MVSSYWCLISNSVVLARTSSHMWKRLYLPVFLFKVELYTLIYGLLYCPGKPIPQPAYYEFIHIGKGTSGGVVTMY